MFVNKCCLFCYFCLLSSSAIVPNSADKIEFDEETDLDADEVIDNMRNEVRLRCPNGYHFEYGVGWYTGKCEQCPEGRTKDNDVPQIDFHMENNFGRQILYLLEDNCFGYAPKTCEKCLNGGTCQNGECQCADDHVGTHCEFKKGNFEQWTQFTSCYPICGAPRTKYRYRVCQPNRICRGQNVQVRKCPGPVRRCLSEEKQEQLELSLRAMQDKQRHSWLSRIKLKVFDVVLIKADRMLDKVHAYMNSKIEAKLSRNFYLFVVCMSVGQALLIFLVFSCRVFWKKITFNPIKKYFMKNHK